MFRVLLAHPQEALHVRRIADYCVLLLYCMYTTCSVWLYWVGYEWIRKCSRFLYVMFVDVGWSHNVGRLLCEGKDAAICPAVRPNAVWCARYKSVDILGYSLRIAALEWAACGGGRIGCIVVRTGLVVRIGWRVLVMSWCHRYVHKWSVQQVGCVYCIITSPWCTVNKTLNLSAYFRQAIQRQTTKICYNVTAACMWCEFFILFQQIQKLQFYYGVLWTDRHRKIWVHIDVEVNVIIIPFMLSVLSTFHVLESAGTSTVRPEVLITGIV
jgi:hypothetical protein